MIFPEPEHMIRPIYVGFRGALITLISMLTFFTMADIDRMQHVRAYLAALGVSFALHYVGACWAISAYRRQKSKSNA